MKKTITYLLMFLCSLALQAQQDPQYSQYMFNQVIINPAFIGSKSNMNALVSFRKEWVNVNGAPQTTNFSISGPLKEKKIGVGLHLTEESIGPKKWISAYADYCYRLRLGDGKISFGLSTGLISYAFNSSKLDLYDQQEPVLYNNSINRSTRFDMNAGIYYFTRTFYAGISATHLTNPRLFTLSAAPNNARFYNLSQHFFVTVGKAFAINEQLVFSPSILIKSVRAHDVNLDVNANFLIKNKLWLGLSGRSTLTMVVIAQYLITDKFKIGYSYDYGFKGIAKTSYGSHEIMLSYDFNTAKSKIVSSRFL